MSEDYRLLCEAVEREASKAVQTPSDFEWLADKIEARVKERVSASTLMRVWGYRKGVATRQGTLDTLARYLGYADYVTFANWTPTNPDEPQSDEVLARSLRTAEVMVGQRVLLTWNPNRRLEVELRDDGCYEVKAAEETKLSVGDTFRCDIFIEGEPLYMSELVHKGLAPMVYVAGKKDGIHFEMKNEE